MKIIHTADWHLGARLRRIDRGEDLERAVAGVFDLCMTHDADVLLIAGDLFDGACRNRPEDLCRAVDHLKDAARPFLRRGGTILAMTGNHDGETFCDTFQHAQSLADPNPIEPGALLETGRLYLITRPAFVHLADPDGQEVQFVLMPYPTARRYLDGEQTPYGPGASAKHQLLLEGFRLILAKIRSHRRFDARLHSVLAAHLHVTGSILSNGHRGDDQDDVVVPAEEFDAGWAYVALGHVHKPQTIGGRDHVRYSGSIERLRIDEMGDRKQVVLVEIGPEGRRGGPIVLPLEATPFLDLDLAAPDPLGRLADLRVNSPDAARTLVRCRVRYVPGVDDPDRIRDEVFARFPRCYEFDPIVAGDDGADANPPAPDSGLIHEDVRATVLGYLRSQLGEGDSARAVIAAAEALIEEVQS